MALFPRGIVLCLFSSGLAVSCRSHPPPVTPAHVDAPPLPPAPPPPAPSPPPPTWPKDVNVELTAPDGFHLVAAKGNDVLVSVTGMIDYVEPRSKHQVRGNTSYLARVDLETGCMRETYDFPTMNSAASTGSVRAALLVLARPEMAAELERARALVLAFGPNASPIAISADGKNAVLEANNQIYLAKDGKSEWSRVGDRAGRNPVLTADGAHVVVSLGGGAYRPHVMDLPSGKLHAVTGKHSYELAAGDVYPLADGSVLAVETNGINRSATRICVTRIDTQRYTEKELLCVPANVISASVSELSADERYLALMVEKPQQNRVVVYDTKTWEKVTEVDGNPTYRAVDSKGRIAWDERNGVVLVSHGTKTDKLQLPPPEEGLPLSTFVGFANDRLVIGHPVMAPFEDEKPLKKLADVSPCGFLGVLDAP